MAKKPLEKKVLYLFGNEGEFGQILSNIIALNPELEIIKEFTTSTVRAKKTAIAVQNPEFEAVIMTYIIYTNPGEVKLMPDSQNPTDIGEPGKVKAKFNIIN